MPDVNADEILAALDTDTRAYLRLLINGAGKGLKGRGGDLREVFRRLGPLHRDLAALNGEVVKRRRNLARLVHNYGSTVDRLGREDRDLASLVSGANRVFGRLSREDQNISEAVSRLPGTLAQTEATLRRVRVLGPGGRPRVRGAAARRAPDRLHQPPAAPAGRDRPSPCCASRCARSCAPRGPYVDQVRPAATNLAKASPDLRESFFELNRFFNMAAYNPGGRERLTGNADTDRARDEGLLFWLGWVAHNSNLVFSTGDAQGPYRRIILNATCTTYRQILEQLGAAGPAAATDRGAAEPAGRHRPLPAVMIKEAPSLGRMLAMTGFAFSCVCLLLFLWLQFGGSLPLRAESYQLQDPVRRGGAAGQAGRRAHRGAERGQGRGPGAQGRQEPGHDRDRAASTGRSPRTRA